ncbi:MAG: hypothetical protein AAB074_11215 [Planctomycetota bacterium]
MGTRRQMEVRILKSLASNGWRREFVEHGREDWFDEMWALRSVSPPSNTKAWMAFIVDPEWKGTRAPGEGVWAVAADTVRRAERAGWLIEIPLGRRWERGLPELLEALQAARAAKLSLNPVAQMPAVPAGNSRLRVKERWKHLR